MQNLLAGHLVDLSYAISPVAMNARGDLIHLGIWDGLSNYFNGDNEDHLRARPSQQTLFTE